MFRKNSNPFLNICIFIITAFVVFYILHLGANLIIPFIIAVLFSFAIIGLSNFYKKFKLPVFISFSLSLASYIFIFWLIGKIIGSNVSELKELMPVYQEKIINIINSFLNYLPQGAKESISKGISSINLTKIFSLFLDTITSIFSSAGIILFYVIFILLEYRYFKRKLDLMIKDKFRKKEIFETIEKIKNDIKSYFVIKTIVSIITASLSYIVMIAFDLDFAVFWAFLVFILNFIPSIGSIIAVSIAVIFSLVQFGNLYQVLFLTSGLVGVQVLMGNIIEPKFMGNKLNLSPLVIILSLGFWGSLWGIIGMLLSVPIMVMLNIVFAKIPATRSIAILLSEKGDLQIQATEDIKKTRKSLINKVKRKLKRKK